MTHPVQATSQDPVDTRSAIRPNSKCSKVNAKLIIVVKGKTLQCKKGKAGHFWRQIASPNNQARPSQPVGMPQKLSIVPEWGNNALFTMNQRFGPEIAQTFTFNEPVLLDSFTLDPRCITYVPIAYYTGQNQNHALEEFKCKYPDIDVNLTTSIYKISDQFNGNPSRFRISGLTPIAKTTQNKKMVLESEFKVNLDPAVRLEPGHYAVTFGFQLSDPNVNTVWFGGHQHNEGPQPACVTQPANDIYTFGSAYRGEPENSYTGLADNFRGFADLFVAHLAKVQSCIVVGNFTGDVFAPGDVNLVMQFRPIRT